MEEKFKKFIVWVDYGSEGWSPSDYKDTFEEAAESMLYHKGSGNQNVVITEYIPVKVVPARIEKLSE